MGLKAILICKTLDLTMILFFLESLSHLALGAQLAGSTKVVVGRNSKHHEQNEALQKGPGQNMKFWQPRDRGLICIDFIFCKTADLAYSKEILSALVIKVSFCSGHQLTQKPISGQNAKSE